MTAGRPKFIPTPEICAKAEKLASRGLTVEQIARSLGVSETTVYDRQAEYPDFMKAIKDGRAKGLAAVSNALYEKAVAGDNTAMIFYLKNRDRESWGDRPEGGNSADDAAKALREIADKLPG